MNILPFSFMNLNIVCFLLLFYNPVIYLHDCVSMWHHGQVSSSSTLALTDSKLLLTAIGVTALFTLHWRIGEKGTSSQISIKSWKKKKNKNAYLSLHSLNRLFESDALIIFSFFF